MAPDQMDEYMLLCMHSSSGAVALQKLQSPSQQDLLFCEL